MSKFYKKNNIFNLNDHFEEEVLDHELEERKDPEIRVVHKINVIVLILFFLSLLLLLHSCLEPPVVYCRILVSV